MMKDRLQELLSAVEDLKKSEYEEKEAEVVDDHDSKDEHDSSSKINKADDNVVDVESLEEKAKQEEECLEFVTNNELRIEIVDFLEEIGNIMSEIHKVAENVKNLGELHSRVLEDAEMDSDLNNQVDEEQSEIRIGSQKIRSKLRKIQNEKDNPNDEKGGNWNERVIQIQHMTTSRLFMEVMKSFQDEQQKYQFHAKRRIKRALEITNKDLDENEIEDAVEKISKGEDIQMFSGFEFDEEQTKEIESRHNDLIELEKSLLELKEVFTEMAIMIEQQGEALARVSDQVDAAQDYVESAKKQTAKAVISQKSTNKKWIILAVVLIILVLVIILPIVL